MVDAVFRASWWVGQQVWHLRVRGAKSPALVAGNGLKPPLFFFENLLVFTIHKCYRWWIPRFSSSLVLRTLVGKPESHLSAGPHISQRLVLAFSTRTLGSQTSAMTDILMVSHEIWTFIHEVPLKNTPVQCMRIPELRPWCDKSADHRGDYPTLGIASNFSTGRITTIVVATMTRSAPLASWKAMVDSDCVDLWWLSPLPFPTWKPWKKGKENRTSSHFCAWAWGSVYECPWSTQNQEPEWNEQPIFKYHIVVDWPW